METLNFLNTPFPSLETIFSSTSDVDESNLEPLIDYSNYETIIRNFLIEKYTNELITLDSDTKKIDYIFILHEVYAGNLYSYKKYLNDLSDSAIQKANRKSAKTERFINSSIVLKVQFHQHDAVIKYIRSLYKTFLDSNDFPRYTGEITFDSFKELIATANDTAINNWLTLKNFERLNFAIDNLNYLLNENSFNVFFSDKIQEIRNQLTAYSDTFILTTEKLVSKYLPEEEYFLQGLKQMLTSKYSFYEKFNFAYPVMSVEDLLLNRFKMETISENHVLGTYLEITHEDLTVFKELFASMNDSDFSVTLKIASGDN